VDVPPERLPPDVLRRVVEEFVTRDGTDYGEVEPSLEEKVARVMGALRRGEAVLQFDPESETCHVVPRP
jgi:hypothetical protein